MVDLYEKDLPGDLRVTDYTYVDGNNVPKVGYTMNRLLYNNVKMIPKHLAGDHMLIGVVSGSGGTRIGKTTFAFQIAYAASWHLCGGVMDDMGNVIQKPTKEPSVKYFFDVSALSEDLANNTDDYQCYVLDESDDATGGQSGRSRFNKEFRDLIIRSAKKKFFLLLNLPDFFTMGQNWACVQTDFMINVFTVGGKRGYFKFYDRPAKERLFFWGKKKMGEARYANETSWPTFAGTFPHVFPLDKDKYENEKNVSLLEVNQFTKKKSAIQRDNIIAKAYELTGLSREELANEFGMAKSSIDAAIQRSDERKDYTRERNKLKGGVVNGTERGADQNGNI